MKTIIDAIRDFIYNITDYGLIITVIVVMALILGWRFDILFNRGIEKDVIADLPQIIVDNNTPGDQNETEPGSTEEPGNTEEKPQETPAPSGVIATVVIPEGSFPSAIAEILINSNLISNKNEFLNRCVDLGLDTRLRSGTYEIEVGTGLDDIIKIIANAQ